MNHLLRFMHSTRQSNRAPLLVCLIACLLAGIRAAAAIVCSTCFLDFEKPPARSFYLHSGGDQNRCHHGLASANSWIVWACSVNEDEAAFVLPEIPRLPVIVSVFVPLVLLLVSYRTLFPIAAHGRGPPIRVS